MRDSRTWFVEDEPGSRVSPLIGRDRLALRQDGARTLEPRRRAEPAERLARFGEQGRRVVAAAARRQPLGMLEQADGEVERQLERPELRRSRRKQRVRRRVVAGKPGPEARSERREVRRTQAGRSSVDDRDHVLDPVAPSEPERGLGRVQEALLDVLAVDPDQLAQREGALAARERLGQVALDEANRGYAGRIAPLGLHIVRAADLLVAR